MTGGREYLLPDVRRTYLVLRAFGAGTGVSTTQPIELVYQLYQEYQGDIAALARGLLAKEVLRLESLGLAKELRREVVDQIVDNLSTLGYW